MSNLNKIISILTQNDPNSTWEEYTTIQEIKEGLLSAMEGYTKEEENYIFYSNILKNLV